VQADESDDDAFVRLVPGEGDADRVVRVVTGPLAEVSRERSMPFR